MERLTIRNSDGSVSQPTSTNYADVFMKLAAYEDTGLEPADIEELQARNDKQKMMIRKQSERTKKLLAAVQKWHPVSDPPKENGRYYVAYEDSVSFLDYFNGKWFFPPRNGIVTEETKESILYWMPLPEPPPRSSQATPADINTADSAPPEEAAK